jgi:hypothetical protein
VTPHAAPPEAHREVAITRKAPTRSDPPWRGHWLPIARAAWLLLAVAELGLFTVALPARYAQLAAPNQAVRAELAVLGLSPDRYAFYQVALDTIFVVVFATIGGLIFLRKPGDPVALLVALMLVTWGPGNDIMVLTPGALLPPEPLTWWHWPFVLIEYVAFMSWMLFFYLFPSGRFVPRGARWLAVGWIVFAGLWNFFGATPLAPLNWPKPLFAVAIAVLWGSFPVCQVYRYRRASDAVQRQQTKWVVFGVAVAVVGFLLTLVAVGPPPVDLPQAQVGRGLVSMLLMDLFVLAIPVSIGVAVLKYRLFDIDRLINRTLVYGLLTAILGLGYVGAVLVLSQVLGQDRSSLAVAGATLAVAALFQPARRRIQQAVDRRFNRRKYNTAQTIQSFSTHLREQVDLDTLATELLAVADQTMEPTRASLWLRPSAPGSSDTPRSEVRPTTWTY